MGSLLTSRVYAKHFSFFIAISEPSNISCIFILRMAEAVLETVLENLNSLIQKELGLFLGFDQDVKRLVSLFTTIKATLADAE